MALLQVAKKSDSTITKCINIGNVTGTDSIGGIIGYLSGTSGGGIVEKCYNKGSVTGTSNLGSIIGYQASTANTINHLYYLSTLNIKAINNVDYEDKNVTSTTKDIKSFDEFKSWITQFN